MKQFLSQDKCIPSVDQVTSPKDKKITDYINNIKTSQAISREDMACSKLPNPGIQCLVLGSQYVEQSIPCLQHKAHAYVNTEG